MSDQADLFATPPPAGEPDVLVEATAEQEMFLRAEEALATVRRLLSNSQRAMIAARLLALQPFTSNEHYFMLILGLCADGLHAALKEWVPWPWIRRPDGRDRGFDQEKLVALVLAEESQANAGRRSR